MIILNKKDVGLMVNSMLKVDQDEVDKLIKQYKKIKKASNPI